MVLLLAFSSVSLKTIGVGSQLEMGMGVRGVCVCVCGFILVTHWGGFEGKPIDLIVECQVLWSVTLCKGDSH